MRWSTMTNVSTLNSQLPTPKGMGAKRPERLGSWRLGVGSYRRLLLTALAFVAATSMLVSAQGRMDPAKLLKPATDSWPTFNGDYSGRRFSPLTKIMSGNVQQLSLA